MHAKSFTMLGSKTNIASYKNGPILSVVGE